VTPYPKATVTLTEAAVNGLAAVSPMDRIGSPERPHPQ